MAGIEPASRKFDQGSTTSLVGPFVSREPRPGQQEPQLTSRFIFGPRYRRPGSRIPNYLTPIPRLSGEAEDGRDRTESVKGLAIDRDYAAIA
jgi:hypothetical protein